MSSYENTSFPLDLSEEDMISYLFKLLENENEEFNVFALRELQHFKSPKIIETLVDTIKNENSPRKRIAAIKSLKARKPNDYVKETLLNQVVSENESIRTVASEVLLEYGETISTELHSILLETASTPIKSNIISILGDVGTEKTLQYFNENKFIENKDLSKQVTEAIRKIKNRNIKLLLDDLQKNKEF